MYNEKQYLLLLRVLLISAGIAWGVSVCGLIFPWGMVENELAGLGAEKPIDDVMIIYWLKMAAAVYTFVGLFYVVIAVWPEKFRAMIVPIGVLHVILGVVFLVNGLVLGIEAIPLYVDVGFCLCVGVGVLWAYRGYLMKN